MHPCAMVVDSVTQYIIHISVSSSGVASATPPGYNATTYELHGQ